MSNNTPLQRNHYGFWVPVPTRWMDNDVYGHVNNVTYYSYFDTAANDFLINAGGLDFRDGQTVAFVVASRCDYKKAIAFPDALEVGVRVNHLGNTSVEYGIAVFRKEDKDAAACGSFTHVFVSRETQRPVPIPTEIRTALESLVDYAA